MYTAYIESLLRNHVFLAPLTIIHNVQLIHMLPMSMIQEDKYIQPQFLALDIGTLLEMFDFPPILTEPQ